MDRGTWRDVLGSADVADGLTELFDELERSGWYARKRMGSSGLKFWPENGRGYQYVIDTRLPLNPHRLEVAREKTGLPLNLEINEGGQ